MDGLVRRGTTACVRSSGDLRSNLVSAAADQPLIGRDQRHVRADPDPAVAAEHIHVEMKMTRGAVRMVEIVRDHADLVCFRDLAAVEQAAGIHGRRVHMHVTETDMLAARVDLQRRRLLLRRTDPHAIADGDDRLLFGIAAIAAIFRRTRTWPDVLALMAETARALADAETARLAEIVAPWIGAAGRSGLV